MVTITAKWDARTESWLKNKSLEKALLRAAKKAGSDALRALRAAAKRETRARVRIRAGYLADRALPLHYAKGRKLEDMEWRMDVSGREVPLGEYPRRQTRRGVSVEVQRGKRVLLKSAFLARARGGRMGVFKRPGPERRPMGHRLGLRVSDSMQDGRVPGAALERAGWVFARALRRLMEMELKAG